MILAALSGVAIGWCAGSWTACSASASGCEVRVASIEAAGTWVGGLATAAGLIFAGAELRHTRRSASEHAAKQLDELRVLARKVTLQVEPRSDYGGYLTGVVVKVTNKTDRYVTRVELTVRGKKIPFMQDQIHPSRFWTWRVDASDLFEVPVVARPRGRVSEEPEVKRAVRERAHGRVFIEYTIDTARFKRDPRNISMIEWS